MNLDNGKDTEHGKSLDANQKELAMDPQGLLEDTDKGKGAENDKPHLDDSTNSSTVDRYKEHYFEYQDIVQKSLGICRLLPGSNMPKVSIFTGTSTFHGEKGMMLNNARRRSPQCVEPSYAGTHWWGDELKWYPGLLPTFEHLGCHCFKKFIEECQPDADTTTHPPTPASDRRRSGWFARRRQSMNHECMHNRLCSCPRICGEYKKGFGCPADSPSPYGFLQQQMEHKKDVAPPEAMMMNASDTEEQGRGGDGLMKRSTRMPEKEASASLDETLEQKCE